MVVETAEARHVHVIKEGARKTTLHTDGKVTATEGKWYNIQYVGTIHA